MTPQETETLHELGQGQIDLFIINVNQALWHAIYTYLFFKAINMLLYHQDRRRTPWPSLLTTTAISIMYLTSLVLWATDMATFIIETKYTLLDQPDVAVADKFNAATNALTVLNNAALDLYGYLVVLGDAIIIWRVHVVMPHGKKWLTVVPSLTLLGSFIAALMMTWCSVHYGSFLVLGAFIAPPSCKRIQLSTLILPFCTTALATTFIMVRMWHYRRSIRPALHSSELNIRRKSHVEQVLLLLIESGILYLFLFAIPVLYNMPVIQPWIQHSEVLTFLVGLFAHLGPVFTGIYPTAIIILAPKYASIEFGSLALFRGSSQQYDDERNESSITMLPNPGHVTPR